MLKVMMTTAGSAALLLASVGTAAAMGPDIRDKAVGADGSQASTSETNAGERTPPRRGIGNPNIRCLTSIKRQEYIERVEQRLAQRGLRANVISPSSEVAPWDVQLNGEILVPGRRQFTPSFPIREPDPADITQGITPPVEAVDVTPGTFAGTSIVVPYRICKADWFTGNGDPDVIPPIDNSDPPFPGFPFEGMEYEDEEEALIIEAMQLIEAAAPITFVPVDPIDGRFTFLRGTPILLFVKGAEAEPPFLPDEFLDGDGASFSIAAGMTGSPLVMLAPDPGAIQFPTPGGADLAVGIQPWQLFQLIDEEEIPRDDMENLVMLPGYDPNAFPGIPEGRLPVLDVDDLDNDGIAAELGDDMNPGTMYEDWEPRPFMDRRFGEPTYVIDYMEIDDSDGDGDFADDDSNPDDVNENADGSASVPDILEGYEISPFTAMIVMHPDALEAGGEGTRAVIIHEILHALGFSHEHQRADRDTFIEVFEENIAPGQLGQFAITGGDLGTYDFESIMHYGDTIFSGNGQPTMRVQPDFRARYGNVIGTATTLSRGDAEGLRALYGTPNCPADLNGDFEVDLDDLDIFFDLFIENDPRADINGDLVVNINDLFEFVDSITGRRCFAPPPVIPVEPEFRPIIDPF